LWVADHPTPAIPTQENQKSKEDETRRALEALNIREQRNHLRKLFVRWLLGLAAILWLVAAFTDLAEDVWFREGFAWDKPIILAIHQLGNPILDGIMRVVTQLGETGAIVAVILVAAWFARKHRSVDAFAILISFGGAAALNTMMKFLFTRPRPALFPPLVVESGFSFPSGHVTASIAVFGFLAVLLWRGRYYSWAILSGALIPAVAISRIYLGVHYPSDTLGSLIFASLWLSVVFSVRDKYLRQR
jgi:membrane-associated phospholipid phosphatase